MLEGTKHFSRDVRIQDDARTRDESVDAEVGLEADTGFRIKAYCILIPEFSGKGLQQTFLGL